MAVIACRLVRAALFPLALLILFFSTHAHAEFALCPKQSALPYGITALGFPQAWLKTCGHGNVAVLDRGFEVNHPQLQSNSSGNVRYNLSKDCTHSAEQDPLNSDAHCLRANITFRGVDANTADEMGLYTSTLNEPLDDVFRGHGTHVTGIVAAAGNGSISGACPRCSVLMFVRNDGLSTGKHARPALIGAYSSGAQVINLSAGISSGADVLSPLIIEALKRDIVMAAASGNSDIRLTGMDFPATVPGVLAIGGARDGGSTPSGLTFWPPEDTPGGTITGKFGSPSGPAQFLIAPGRVIRSTFYTGATWNPKLLGLSCMADSLTSPYGNCSGTSMSTPHVSALIGMVRSVQPTLSAAQVKDVLRTTASNPIAPGGRTDDYGWGIPDAAAAVTAALGGPTVVNRRTPLFALRSTSESNHVFTTVPQVAMAANEGVLPPRPGSEDFTWGFPTSNPPSNGGLYSTVGFLIQNYNSFVPSPCPPEYPGCTPTVWDTPRASASIMTTPASIIPGGLELWPLYRMSWRCGDGSDATQVAVCNVNPAHVSHYYTTSATEIQQMEARGYHVDGIEGYVYPTTQANLPPDAVQLCRLYNASRDDYLVMAGSANSCANNFGLGDLLAGPEGFASYGVSAVLGYAYAVGAPAPLVTGNGTLTIVFGSNQSAPAGFPFLTPLAVVVRDAAQNPMPNVAVVFTAPQGGPGATLSAITVVTDANGVAQVNATANTLTGSYTVTASSGSLTPVAFGLTNRAGQAASISASSGTPQSRLVNSAFAPLQVVVRDQFNNVVPNALVTFAAPASGASASLSATSATTDAQGVASVTAIANGIGGSYTVTATTPGPGSTASFSLTNQAPTSLAVVSGSPQTALFNTAFGARLTVRVLDQASIAIAGVTVSFTAPATGASAALSPATVTTLADGTASTTAVANGTVGSYAVTANVPGLAPVPFALTNNGPASIAINAGTAQSTMVTTAFPVALSVIVRDMANNPMSGVTVSFTGPATGAGATLSVASAVTNASGVASTAATANGTAGSYAVTASVANLAQTAAFALTNNPRVPAVSVLSGSGQSALTAAAFAAPLRVVVKDQAGGVMPGVSVTFTGPPATGASASLSATSVVTDATGTAQTSATANGIAGSYVVTATAAGASASASFSLTNAPRVPSTIAVAGGSSQSVLIGRAFAAPLTVVVRDQAGAPFSGATVSFAAPASGASAALSAATVVTNASGQASVAATANGAGGSYVVTASVAGVATSAPFSLTNLIVNAVTVSQGSNQGTPINTTFTTPLRVIVRDQLGGLLDGVTVTFTVPASGASASLSATSVVTSGGAAQVTATANATLGSYAVVASAGGFSAIFTLTNQPPNFFVNGGFESPFVGNGGDTGGPLAPWTGSSGVMSNEALFTHGVPPAPQGVQAADFATYGNLAQSATLGAGSYTVSFLAATGAYAIGVAVAPHPVMLYVDGALVGTVTAPVNVWQPFTIKVPNLAAGTHTFQFFSDGGGAGNMIVMDDVRLNLVPTSMAIVNGSFESPFGTGQQAAGWIGAQIIGNDRLPVYGVQPAPDGTQVSIVYFSTSGPTQTLELSEGFYYITFNASLSTVGYPATALIPRWNGVPQATFAAPGGAWGTFTVLVGVPQRGSYTLDIGSDGTGLAFVDNVRIAQAPTDTTFVNGGFESPVVASAGAAAAGWGGGGVMTSARAALYSVGPAPEGNQLGYMSAGNSIYQGGLNLLGGTYLVSFCATTALSGFPTAVRLRVDGVERGAVTAAANTWGCWSLSVAVATGTHMFEFVSDGLNGGYVFLDNARLARQ